MECTVIEGKTSDIVEFTRSGVERPLVVDCRLIRPDARLGFLLGAFAAGSRPRSRRTSTRCSAEAGATKKTPATKTAAKKK